MDPISITTACVGAIGTISKVSVQVAGFVSNVRDARRDMEAVSRELTSLTICLTSLRNDSENVKFPETLSEVVCSCDRTAKEMAEVLSKLSTTKTARIRWTMADRDQINKLRSSLESHKSCIDVALDMASFQLLSAMKEETSDIKAETSAIKKDTSEIPSIKQDTLQIANLIQEIGFLRMQVSDLRREEGNGDILLQRFLDESTTYAESAVDPSELQSVQLDDRTHMEGVGEDEDSNPSSSAVSPHIPPKATSNRSSLSGSPQVTLTSEKPFSERLKLKQIATTENVNKECTGAENHEVKGHTTQGLSRTATSPWAITKGVKEIYDGVFRDWDPSGKGFISREVAVQIMSQSGLNQKDLEHIWDLSEPNNSGRLDMDEFAVTMHLVYQKLNGYPVPVSLPPELVPLRRKTPVWKLQDKRLQFITELDQRKFEKLFESALGNDEFLSEEKARELLLRSKLPESELARIWDLSNTRNMRNLEFPEFVLAMYLCNVALTGKELPTVLPERMQKEISEYVDRIFDSRWATNPGNQDAKRIQKHDEALIGSEESSSISTPEPSTLRTWRDRTGTFQTEAWLVGGGNEIVHLRKKNGVTIAIPVSKLSPQDLEYIGEVDGWRFRST